MKGHPHDKAFLKAAQSPPKSAASLIARHDIKIFPVRPESKRPYIKGWPEAATRELKQVKDWWLTWPDSMIGLLTGEKNKIFVLDIDRHGVDGFESLAELEAQHGKLPATLTVLTPSGGQHRYFKLPEDREIRNSAAKIAPGLDVRGEGGYVVCPPSVNGDGKKYRVRYNRPVVDAPEWLLDLIAPLGQPERQAQKDRPDGMGIKQSLKKSIHPYVKAAVDAELAKLTNAEPGTRNDTLNQVTFALYQWVGGGELEDDEARAGLEQAGEACGLEADEIQRTIESGLTAGMNEPRAVPETESERRPERKKSESKLSGLEGLRAMVVTDDYVKKLGKEAWLFENLIIKNQITTIIAESGGGKTAICFDFIAEWIIKHHGMTVYYLDVDSPANDHKRMQKRAHKLGEKFQWLNSNTHGREAKEMIEFLKKCVDDGERLDDVIFFFDTLKQFVDVLDKRSVKPFFVLMKQLAALGATCVLLGHANKFRAADGRLVFEGVGDVRNDTDALIFFERITDPDGDGNFVTTICDQNKGAKLRGLYEVISFHVSRNRTVSVCDEVVPVPDWGEARKPTEGQVKEKIREYLNAQGEEVKKSDIIDALQSKDDISRRALRAALDNCPPRDKALPGEIYVAPGGKNNAHLFGVRDKRAIDKRRTLTSAAA